MGEMALSDDLRDRVARMRDRAQSDLDGLEKVHEPDWYGNPEDYASALAGHRELEGKIEAFDAALAEIGEPVSREELAAFLWDAGVGMSNSVAALCVRQFSVRRKPQGARMADHNNTDTNRPYGDEVTYQEIEGELRRVTRSEFADHIIGVLRGWFREQGDQREPREWWPTIPDRPTDVDAFADCEGKIWVWRTEKNGFQYGMGTSSWFYLYTRCAPLFEAPAKPRCGDCGVLHDWYERHRCPAPEPQRGGQDG